jgi:hypothetical protein
VGLIEFFWQAQIFVSGESGSIKQCLELQASSFRRKGELRASREGGSYELWEKEKVTSFKVQKIPVQRSGVRGHIS